MTPSSVEAYAVKTVPAHEKGYYVPTDLMAWSGTFLQHPFAPTAGPANL